MEIEKEDIQVYEEEKKRMANLFEKELNFIFGKDDIDMRDIVCGIAAVSYASGRVDKAKEILENS